MVQAREFIIVSHQIVNTSGKLDYIIDPPAFFRPKLGNHPFVRERLPGEVIIPGMAIEEVVLEKIDMGQNVIKDHYIQPVRVIVIIKGDCRAGVNDGFIRIGGVKFILALFL